MRRFRDDRVAGGVESIVERRKKGVERDGIWVLA